MPNSLFISYSRQEVSFVDMLFKALEGSGFQPWLDYQSLIPGRPWFDQILAGIDAAEIVLLVVSRSSIDSKNVKDEYQRALEQKKRILLLIFEAVPLPPVLQSCEWIDFRGSFNKQYKLLLAKFDKASPQVMPPQKGFKTSFTIWLAFVISLVTVVASIPGWWTIFIPVLLIPLPFQILKRNFHFYRVRFALLTLPVVLALSWAFFLPYEFTNVPFTYCWIAGSFTAPILLLLLASKRMRAWGKPSASAPQTAQRYIPDDQLHNAVPFYIEHAPEDTKYANAIIKGLTKYGHPQVTDAAQAQISFAVISRYKNTTSVNPEKQIVFPILVQDTVIEDAALQRVQWIDFRRGLKNLKNLALLLPEPTKLTKALGVIPISGQVLYPRIIQMLDYFLTLLAFFSASIWIPLWFEFNQQFLAYQNLIPFLIVNIIVSVLIVRAVFLSRRALVNREGKLASLGRLIGSILWIGFLGIIQSFYIASVLLILTDAIEPVLERGTAITFLPLSFVVGFVLIALFGLMNWGDLTRWFPQRQRK